jgi:Protein of unknown function (DUF2934)
MSRIGTQPQTTFGNTTSTSQTGNTTQGATNQIVNNPVLRDRVAKRAYEKWLKNGCRQGCDQQNWLEAEAEIIAEQNRTGSTFRS